MIRNTVLYIYHSFKIISSLKTSYNMLTSVDEKFIFNCLFIGKYIRWFCFIYTAAVSINCLRYWERMLRTFLTRFLVNILIQNIIQAFCLFHLYNYIIYDWIITIMGDSKHYVLPKKMRHITPLRPRNRHFSTTATFVSPQHGRYGEARLHFPILM